MIDPGGKTEVEVVDILLPWASWQLLHGARPALALLRELIYRVCCFHNLDSCDLIEEHEEHHRESLVEVVDLVVTDMLCNIKWIYEDQQ